MNYVTFDPLRNGECCVTAMIHMPIQNVEPFTKPAIIICPGGGYTHLSQREAAPVAEAYFAKGYNTFVLEYSVGDLAKGFRPLIQLAGTMSYIREHAQQWLIDPNKIAVCGFSAGGHLAASLGTLFNDEKFLKICPPMGNIRPNAMILGYPVILSNELAHAGSICMVSGQNSEDSEEYRYFGLDLHVDSHTPPTFIWHTASDNCVPVENSLFFAAALSAAKVPVELHVLPSGDHGMSLCTRSVNAYAPYNGRWFEWSVKWLNRLFGFAC